MTRNKIKKSRIIAMLAFVLISTSSVFFIANRSDDFETIKNLDVFYTLFKELNLYYVDDIDAGEIIETGIDAMLKSLDPYTVYISESEIEDFKFMTTGQYGGIGALIRQNNNYIVIAEPYQGFPAANAGLIAGDKILEIDGKKMEGKKTSDISELLKGQPNTNVVIKIERYGVEKPITIELTRKEVKVPSVPYYGMLENGIAYIILTRFTHGASKEIRDALTSLKKENEIKGIIFDLRSNPGGLLMEAVNISNLFIPKGEEIVSTRGKVAEWDKTYTAPREAMDKTIPLVILVNRGSASASEIVSGAIQDFDRGVIIGERTFGKGLVQTTRELSYNSKLKVTTAKYYIPSGRCIQALNYSHRNEDGSVGKIADSLVSEFSTKGGRPVFDGGGINPDIIIESEIISNIAIALVIQNVIFDYATVFAANHDTINSPSTFGLSDADYIEFMEFAMNKDFTYDTKSEEVLNELIKITEREKYYNEVDDELKALKTKLYHNVEKDLKVFKDEVIKLINAEIITRYYHRDGRIEYSLSKDEEITKAIEVLIDTVMYKQILDGTYVNLETE